MMFKDLSIGVTFKFAPSTDGFWKDHNTYVKISARKYKSANSGVEYVIGSIKSKVSV